MAAEKKSKSFGIYIAVALLAIVIVLLAIIALGGTGAGATGEGSFLENIKNVFNYTYVSSGGGNGGGSGGGSGNGGTSDCEQYNLSKQAREFFGNVFVDTAKNNCQLINPTGWTEGYSEVSCYVDGLSAINCSSATHISLKNHCLGLDATWICRPDFAGCLCEKNAPDTWDYECGYLYDAGLGECEGDCDPGEKCVLEGDLCHCVEDTFDIECKDAPVDDVDDWLECLNYSCPANQECYWQPDLGHCGCQGEDDCGYHYVDKKEICNGDCDNPKANCVDYWNTTYNSWMCECLTADENGGQEPNGDIPGCQIRVFVTSISGDGDIGGLLSADGVCVKTAGEAALGGTWKALISNGRNAKDVVADCEIVLVDKVTKVADNKADLLDGSVDNAIDLDEYGKSTTNVCVWTGSKSTGDPSGNDCKDWITSNKEILGTVGIVGPTNSRWIDYGPKGCDYFSCHLYCIEQIPV